MVASLYVPSEECPTYDEYRKKKRREYCKTYKARNKEKVRDAEKVRLKRKYANDTAFAEKVKARSNRTYKNNPEKGRERAKAKRLTVSGTAEYVEKQRAYREKNRVELKEYKRSWAKKNAARVNLRNAARRALCAAATPIWANKQDIEDVYAEARYFQLHVDHIVPLNHPLVCGLHVWENLQLLTPLANMQKNNRFDPETYDAS